jgi:hypothetical protein
MCFQFEMRLLEAQVCLSCWRPSDIVLAVFLYSSLVVLLSYFEKNIVIFRISLFKVFPEVDPFDRNM